MYLLNKETDYAIRALLELSKKSTNFVSARSISDNQHIPYQFLRRILQKLIKNNLVESKEGNNGGVRLKEKPENIAVLGIIKIFQGELELSSCLFRKQLCANRNTCALRTEIKRIEKLVTDEFKNITIKNLLQKTGGEIIR